MNNDQGHARSNHNRARAELAILPLQWHNNLAVDAQQYANFLATRDQGLQHSQSRGGQGENLACFSSSNGVYNPLTQATEMWLREKGHWHGGPFTGRNMHEHGHYTQMIWGSSTHLDMGVSTARSGTVYVVARYWPAGNIVGRSPDPRLALIVVPDVPSGGRLRAESDVDTWVGNWMRWVLGRD